MARQLGLVQDPIWESLGINRRICQSEFISKPIFTFQTNFRLNIQTYLLLSINFATNLEIVAMA